jgi:hypothetical protein
VPIETIAEAGCTVIGGGVGVAEAPGAGDALAPGDG